MGGLANLESVLVALLGSYFFPLSDRGRNLAFILQVFLVFSIPISWLVHVMLFPSPY
jgi:hypothetical protein